MSMTMASLPNFNSSHHLINITYYLLFLFLVASRLHTSKLICLGVGDELPIPAGSTKPCIEEERQALLTFKQHLIDPSGRLSSWVGHNCCQWKGISCESSTSHVAKLDLRSPYQYPNYDEDEEPDDEQLRNLSLGGKVNPSLLSLKHLNYLDLSVNDFQGIQIPEFFGQLKSLRYLNISSASFRGEIPSSLGNLSNLNYLDLSFNYDIKYSLEIPSSNLNWLSRLSSLKYLNLGGIDLSSTGVSWLHAVNMLPSLLELHLSGCQIESLPLSLQRINFTSLLVLDVSYNYLNTSSFPSWLFKLTSLRKLFAANNYFNCPFPAGEFASLKSLKVLDLGNTLLKGQIPKVIGNLCNLKMLSLYGNDFGSGQIEEIFRGFSDCPNKGLELEVLDLSDCQLEGLIPASLGMLNNLQHLQLGGNNLWGSIPESIGNLSTLKILDLSSNNMNGSIPESLGKLSQLVSLDLSWNSWEGHIPASLGMLNNLQHLNLGGNRLWGSIPESIVNLSSLKTLDLQGNNMNGSIPESLGKLSQLVSLDLSGNSWEGILTEAHFTNLTSLRHLTVDTQLAYDWVPPFKLHTIEITNCRVGPGFLVWLQSQTELIYVTLRNTSISEDSIPEEWLLNISSRVRSLDLSYNQFRGKLPSQLEFPNLWFLDLSDNQFEGALPLLSAINVSYLNFGHNSFAGPIPFNFGQLMPSLLHLYLNDNNLNGTIPPSICHLQSLMTLSLRNNQLFGEFPHAWSLWSQIGIIDVANNSLSGNIPSTMGIPSSLVLLKMNNNDFRGEIPFSLQNCSGMQRLDLGGNKLTGNLPLWIGSNVSTFQIIRLRSNLLTGHITQQLCSLAYLHILDLGHNNFSGTIPKCLDNMSSLVHTDPNAWRGIYGEQTTITLKGQELEYIGDNIGLVKSIDLSSNNLQGEIPEEVSSLSQLATLNLSMNQLTGKIPSKIGNLRLLESLDLSRNNLSGLIPQSLSSLTFLSHLNLSHNNLIGRIPSGNQLQTLDDPSIYKGNPSLCGRPLSIDCPGDILPTKENKDGGNDREELWFYFSMVFGFIIGFWSVCGTLIIKKSWRYAYFQFFDNIKDKAALVIALKVARWRRE